MIPRLYGLIAVALLAMAAAIYLAGRSHGSASCEARHAAAQAQHNEKVRKSDAIRDREKPVTSDRDKLYEWLLKYGRE